MQNVDVEVDVDEVLEVDVLQWTKTMSKRKAKSMSMLEVEAKRCHQEGKDLVEEDDVEEVVRKMVMCRCGCGGSLPMASREDLDGTSWSSATMLKSSPRVFSEGCSELGLYLK